MKTDRRPFSGTSLHVVPWLVVLTSRHPCRASVPLFKKHAFCPYFVIAQGQDGISLASAPRSGFLAGWFVELQDPKKREKSSCLPSSFKECSRVELYSAWAAVAQAFHKTVRSLLSTTHKDDVGSV